MLFLGLTFIKLTLLDARYSIPLATWYAKDTRSFCVRVFLSFSTMPIAGSYPGEDLCCLKKSLRFPWGAYSTTTKRGPFCVQQPSRLMMFMCFPIIFIISISETRSIISLSECPSGKMRSFIFVSSILDRDYGRSFVYCLMLPGLKVKAFLEFLDIRNRRCVDLNYVDRNYMSTKSRKQNSPGLL